MTNGADRQDARGQVGTTRFLNDGAGSDSIYLRVLGIDRPTTRYPAS